MSKNWASFVKPTGCTGNATPGAKALLAYLLDQFPYAYSAGIYNCRPPRGGSGFSEHAEGRAVDLGIPVTGSGGARPELGDPVIELLGPHGKRLGIQLAIYNRRAWSSRSPDGRQYNGVHPHYDHVHLGLTPTAGAQLNYATLEAVLGGAGRAIEIPTLAGVTHRVNAPSLNLRSQPTTAASVVTTLSEGGDVAARAGSDTDADGYRWLEVKAVSGFSIVDGWVASEFLDTVAAPPPPPPPPSLEAISHRVTAPSLNLRSQPTTSAAVVTTLPAGTDVAARAGSDTDADGYRWLEIKAVVGPDVVAGWVAGDFLEALAPPPPPPPPVSTLGIVTHRVTASSLNMRSSPTTSAAIVVELMNDAACEQLVDAPQESDGYRWIKVRSIVGDRVEEGWVAGEFLKAAE